MCDHVAILARGRCVAAGAVDDVLHRGSGRVVVGVDDPAGAVPLLKGNGLDAFVDGSRLIITTHVPDLAAVTRSLAEHDRFVSELRREEADLESVFLELTADKDAG